MSNEDRRFIVKRLIENGDESLDSRAEYFSIKRNTIMFSSSLDEAKLVSLDIAHFLCEDNPHWIYLEKITEESHVEEVELHEMRYIVGRLSYLDKEAVYGRKMPSGNYKTWPIGDGAGFTTATLDEMTNVTAISEFIFQALFDLA